MSRDEIVEHAGYLNDPVKLAAYRAALDQLVTADTAVLDLGSGTGILGMLAARAGARIVYSVDSGSIVATAQAVAEANGLADRMVFVNDSSTRVRLPEPVDLVVGDQIGGLAYDAGVLEYYADARRRLLAPGGVLVPGSFQLLAAPVQARDWDTSVGVWADRPAGFDLGPLFDVAANTEFRVELTGGEILGPPRPWATIDADRVDPITGTAQLTIERPGRLNGVAGMFEAHLAPSVRLTNQPGQAHTFSRWQNLYPLAQPVDVAAGDRVSVTFDVRPKLYVANWTMEVHPAGGGPSVRRRGSTVLSGFLTPTDLALSAGTATPRADKRREADHLILELADGQRTTGEIIDEVRSRFGHLFDSHDDVTSRVHHLLWRYLRPEPPWPDSPTG